MDAIHVGSLMTSSVFSTSPTALLMDVIRSMVDLRYSCIIVVEDRIPIGMVTERDIVRLMGEFLTSRSVSESRVGDVMSAPVVTVSEKTTLLDALVISSAEKIRHLPVVDGEGKMVGLVTQSDLAHAHFQMFEKQKEMIEKAIAVRTSELQEANEQLKELSMVDALTNAGNRRCMEADLDHTHALAMRYQRSYSVLLFDLDYFKLYNDTYGHLAGDHVLKTVARHIQSVIRKFDRLYRYGGEEFLLLLPETPLSGAMILAKRMIESIASLNLPHRSSPYATLTASCGVACQSLEPPHASWREVMALADNALYESKNSGRNRATFIADV